MSKSVMKILIYVVKHLKKAKKLASIYLGKNINLKFFLSKSRFYCKLYVFMSLMSQSFGLLQNRLLKYLNKQYYK